MKQLLPHDAPTADECHGRSSDHRAGVSPAAATSEPLLSRPPADAPQPEAQPTAAGKSQAEVHAQIRMKADLLQWILNSRSWRYTGWLRRANFLSHRLAARLRKPGRDPFRGHLDSPADGGRVSQRMKVVGWAYSVGARVAYVEVFLDAISLGHVRYGLPRLDAAAYPSNAPVACGYEGTLHIDESLAGRRRLTVRVTDTRGRVKDFEQEVEVVLSADPTKGEVAPAGPVSAAAAPTAPAPPQDPLPLGKRTLEVIARASLESLLSSDSVITFPHHDAPETSILLVLYNRAELTLQCLLSILKHQSAPYEVVIVNNASTDETPLLLGRLRGARVVHNQTNLHYLRACNQAARLARGRNLLLLNNDAQLLGDAVAAATQTLDSSPDIGAVGGRVILPDGSLQEAGSIVWRDGSCQGYGRGRAPFAPEFMFRREVDYCSAVFLLTRRDLFLEAGGFDEAFAPAYYEDADYCAALWRKGLRVVYEPRVSVLHYEFASSSAPAAALELQARHRRVFAAKHAAWLRSRSAFAAAAELEARTHRRAGQKRILYLDDRVPHADLGSGFPRSNRILAEMVRLGHAVTIYPTTAPHEEWAGVYRDIPREVEVMLGSGALGLAEFLAERAGYYDLIYVSRPHNMAQLRKLLMRYPQIFAGAKVVYDSEALFSLRELQRLRLKGKTVSGREREERVAAEVRLAEGCHSVITVSELEGREFARHGFQNVRTVGHSLEVAPTPRSFSERRDILFVGAVAEAGSPNADSVLWFSKRVLPIIRKELGEGVKLVVAGHGSQDFLARLNNGAVKVLGRVEETAELYDRARLFVAPTRFAAGIPHKVHEAAAHGLPVVATTLLGRQLGWRDGQELLLADEAEDFATACVRLYSDRVLWERVRAGALARVEADCSPEAFAKRLRAIIG